MSNQNELFKKLISHCKEYGFIFQSSEIYDSLAATYDYGPFGVELKNNIKHYWWKSMVDMNENIVGLDSSVLMHPKVWEASGHVDAFNDPLIDNKDSKKRYRADQLIEDHINKIQLKIDKDILKAEKKFGSNFNKKIYCETNKRVSERISQIQEIKDKLDNSMNKNKLSDIKNLIENLEIKCQISGTKNWTDVRQFNLMFKTNFGSTDESSSEGYLRPETAQGIFVNFLNVQKTARAKIPFGIAQIGKAFRNEIVARQFIFRMREFEQMEMQFFVRPGEEINYYNFWKDQRLKWHLNLGFDNDMFRFHNHQNLAHYANAAVDIEYKFPFGFKELEGIHSRTDFDLKSHQQYSKRKIQYFDSELNKSYIPYVIETSIGLDRMFLAIMCNSYKEEEINDNEKRTVLSIPKFLAPIKLAILPLTRKDGLSEKAKKIFNDLKLEFNCYYEEKDSIGKRYRRQDAIGTPFCLTIDHQTLEDDTCTLRYRDKMNQKRVKIKEVFEILDKEVNLKNFIV